MIGRRDWKCRLATAVLAFLVVTMALPLARARQFDELFPTDLCLADSSSITGGPCDSAQFPVCGAGTLICYNRRPSRNQFWPDNRQPMYYIDYPSVFCYPDTWQGCSSCTPGRYCRSESRCILDEVGYPCVEWI